MTDDRLKRLRTVPRFAENERTLNRLSWGLSLLLTATFIIFNLAVVWAPGWLGTPVTGGTVISRGVVIAVIIIVCAFLLTAFYMRVIGRRMDILQDEFTLQGTGDQNPDKSGEDRP